MARWLLLAVASTLCADAGAGRAPRYADADYSAARMPHYDTLNYDTHSASPHAEDYRDRSPDVAAPDYNHYDQEPNDKKNPKILLDEDSYHMPHNTNLRKELTTIADDVDSEYGFKSEDTNSNNKYNNKRPKKRNNIQEVGPITRRPIVGRNAKKYQRMDDEDTEVPSEHFEVDSNLGLDNDKSKFVRRDISQKVRRKSLDQAAFRDPDYDDQIDLRQGKDRIKASGPLYSDPEFSQNAPNVDNIGANRVAPVSRPPGYKTKGISDDNDDAESPSSRESGRFKAPMPKTRKKINEYVDYNDMSRIEKIKNFSSRRPPARPGATRRWSFQDGFRRRYFDMPQKKAEDYVDISKPAETVAVSVASTAATLNATTPPWLITGVADQPLVPLSKQQIENITAFVNKTKQLSIAEMSQLSILKKAQRRDSVKDEIMKDKPPVLLQVTERLQTVVMVEPPPATQEPWLRARDIAEDSPERIAKVKRFMRNKLVANARNISELMENWDDTVCDYVDISLLDESNAMWVHSHTNLLQLFLISIMAAHSTLYCSLTL